MRGRAATDRFRNVRLASLVLAVCICLAGAARSETPLSNWQLLGKGFVTKVEDAVLLSEYPGSVGVMLVSPEVFGPNLTLRFRVLPLNPETVLVAALSSSDSGPSMELSFPDDYDGSFGHLADKVDSYFFAFHNAAHNRKPFVRRHPFVLGISEDLEEADDNVMSPRWHDVEVSQSGGRLQLKVDGELVLDAVDKNALEGGKLILRLRGTKTHTATALFKDLDVATNE